MRYALAKQREREFADAYRYYVADALYCGYHQQAPVIRLWDMMHPAPEETRTAEEIIGGIRNKLAGMTGE